MRASLQRLKKYVEPTWAFPFITGHRHRSYGARSMSTTVHEVAPEPLIDVSLCNDRHFSEVSLEWNKVQGDQVDGAFHSRSGHEPGDRSQ